VEKDYYAILGVPSSADAGAIKTAYRRLAKKLHPDRTGTAVASVEFNEIAEAYAVLSQHRAKYDARRVIWNRPRAHGPPSQSSQRPHVRVIPRKRRRSGVITLAISVSVGLLLILLLI
jgi:curved DNA-binding protein CbpA